MGASSWNRGGAAVGGDGAAMVLGDPGRSSGRTSSARVRRRGVGGESYDRPEPCRAGAFQQGGTMVGFAPSGQCPPAPSLEAEPQTLRQRGRLRGPRGGIGLARRRRYRALVCSASTARRRNSVAAGKRPASAAMAARRSRARVSQGEIDTSGIRAARSASRSPRRAANQARIARISWGESRPAGSRSRASRASSTLPAEMAQSSRTRQTAASSGRDVM